MNIVEVAVIFVIVLTFILGTFILGTWLHKPDQETTIDCLSTHLVNTLTELKTMKDEKAKEDWATGPLMYGSFPDNRTPDQIRTDARTWAHKYLQALLNPTITETNHGKIKVYDLPP